MSWLQRLFTRGRDLPCFDSVPRYACPRLMPIFRRLSYDEEVLQARLNLLTPPRLSVVDEELAVIVGPTQRDAIELGTDESDHGPDGALGNS